MEITHEKNRNGGFFFLKEEDELIGRLSYIWEDENTMMINSTHVDGAYRGQGLASKLVNEAAALAREKNAKIVPLCSYVRVLFDRDSSYDDLKF